MDTQHNNIKYTTLSMNDTWPNAAGYYAEYRYAGCSILYCYAECRYGECHYAECHYAECRYGA
jgi:hypothetical protein